MDGDATDSLFTRTSEHSRRIYGFGLTNTSFHILALGYWLHAMAAKCASRVLHLLYIVNVSIQITISTVSRNVLLYRSEATSCLDNSAAPPQPIVRCQEFCPGLTLSHRCWRLPRKTIPHPGNHYLFRDRFSLTYTIPCRVGQTEFRRSTLFPPVVILADERVVLSVEY